MKTNNKNILNKRYSKNLKEIREKAGLTQKELSLKTTIPLETISSYERGKRDLRKANYSTLLKLITTLNCDIKDIIEE